MYVLTLLQVGVVSLPFAFEPQGYILHQIPTAAEE